MAAIFILSGIGETPGRLRSRQVEFRASAAEAVFQTL
jgi:hypothetical protein